MPIYRIVKENVSPQSRKINNRQKESKIKIQSARGMDHIPIEDGKYFSFIRKAFFKLAEERNFKEIIIPVFEDLELYQRTIGEETDVVQKELFLIQHRKDDQEKTYAMRPEATAGICRKYIEDGWKARPQPVKISWFGEVFRADKPQAGRYRQFNQAEVDILGSDSVSFDVEIIDFAFNFIKKLGLKNVELEINSIGTKSDREEYLKHLEAHLKSYESSLCETCIGRSKSNPMRVLDCKEEKCQRVTNLGPKPLDYLSVGSKKHFQGVKDGLDNLNVEYIVNEKLVRGLDYYSRTVFEIVIRDDFGDTKYSILGGGRYDYLVEEIGGPETPAVGFAAGVERIILEMKEQGIKPKKKRNRVYLASIGKDAARDIDKLATVIQAAGFKAFKPSVQKGISDQFKEADRMEINWVILVGEHELETGTVLLKDMSTGKQTVVLREKVLESLVERFSEDSEESI